MAMRFSQTGRGTPFHCQAWFICNCMRDASAARVIGIYAPTWVRRSFSTAICLCDNFDWTHWKVFCV